MRVSILLMCDLVSERSLRMRARPVYLTLQYTVSGLLLLPALGGFPHRRPAATMRADTRVGAPLLRRRAPQLAPAAVAWNYTLRDLGALKGDWSCAYDINNAGDIVGAAKTPSGAKHAFLYRNWSMHDLGAMGGHDSIAYAISDAGDVVGQIEGRGGRSPAFLWRGGHLREIGERRSRMNCARAVNGRGDVAGECWDGPGKRYRGFLSHAGQAARSLGTLGGSDGRAFGINDTGGIVGVSATRYDWFHHALLWQDGAPTDLGTLGGSDSEARAINDRGQIVGSAHTAAGDEHACLFGKDTITDLETVAGAISRAVAINEAGVAVGWQALPRESPHACVWRDGLTLDLNRLVALGSDTRLVYAYGINDRGQIVGCGRLHGHPRAFLLTPVGR
jgi:probable HAF family extracellular repeat protein